MGIEVTSAWLQRFELKEFLINITCCVRFACEERETTATWANRTLAGVDPFLPVATGWFRET